MTFYRPFLLVCMLVGVLVVIGGCAGQHPGPTIALPDGVSVEDGRALTAADLYPAGPRAKTYAVTDLARSTDAGRERRETSGVRDDGTWTVTSTPIGPDGSERPATVTTLMRDADGSVVAISVLTPRDAGGAGDRSLFVYEPPLLLAPAVLAPGVVYDRTSAMREMERDAAGGVTGKIVGRGEATRRLRVAMASELVRGGLDGVSAATGVISEQDVRFGPAKDVRTSTLWIGDGGIAMEETVRTLRVMVLELKNERLRYRVLPTGPE